MSFALKIKEEILDQGFSVENAEAFISGLISVSGVRSGNKTIIKLNNHDLSYTIEDMLNQLKIKSTSMKDNKNWIVLENYSPIKEIKLPSYFFAGCFVGGGSISDTQSTSYHLEIQLYEHSNAIKIQNFLNKYFEFHLIQRRKLWVLYIKKSEQISDFLRALQAFDSLLEFEDARIERDFKNQLNRYSNLDTYNQSKLARATEDFKEQFEYATKQGLLHMFHEKELTFFKVKKNNPYSSLQEIANILNKKYDITKTKSGLNHWLIKLRNIVQDN